MQTTDTVTINGFDIVLPIGLEQVMKTPVRDSYQDFLQTDTKLVMRHLTALTTMLPKYVLPYTHCLHCFGGVGATAQVIHQSAPDTTHTFWERDPVLVKYLRETYPDCEVVIVEDSYQHILDVSLKELELYDFILFDPSVGTIMHDKMVEVWAKIAAAKPTIVWLSDTACSKIHLNAKHYERLIGSLAEPTAEGYLQAYSSWLQQRHDLGVVEAMREAQETYAVLAAAMAYPVWSKTRKIPYM